MPFAILSNTGIRDIVQRHDRARSALRRFPPTARRRPNLNINDAPAKNCPLRLANRVLKPKRAVRQASLTLISAILSIATFNTVSFAQKNINCTNVVDKAALRAMDRTNPLAQTFVYGEPVAFGPSLLRVEVEVFGTQDALYDVDVRIDRACNVLSTSVRLESNPWPGR